jgi:hypothetical protein
MAKGQSKAFLRRMRAKFGLGEFKRSVRRRVSKAMKPFYNVEFSEGGQDEETEAYIERHFQRSPGRAPSIMNPTGGVQPVFTAATSTSFSTPPQQTSMGGRTGAGGDIT